MNFIGVLLALLILGIIIRLLANLYKKKGGKKQELLDVKHSVVTETLSDVFAKCIYDPKGSISRDTIKNADLIDDWKESLNSERVDYTGNEYFSGKYKGVGVECCDVEVIRYWTETETDSDGRQTESEHSETCFRGIWMICELDKPIPAVVRIREKKDMPQLLKFARKRVHSKSDIETENLAFNEQFQILTNDAHSAFLILTPHYMEQILLAESKAHGRMLLRFAGNRVHIAIHNGRKSFEVKRISELNDIEALKRRIQGEVRYLTEILDELFKSTSLFGE